VSEQKIHIHRATKWQDYFDGFDTDHRIGFVSRSPKLIQAVWENSAWINGSFRTSVSCIRVPRNFSRRRQYRHFACRIHVADKWMFIKSFTLSIPQKLPHERTRSIRILLKIILRWKCIRVCQKCALSVIRYSFSWIDVQSNIVIIANCRQLSLNWLEISTTTFVAGTPERWGRGCSKRVESNGNL